MRNISFVATTLAAALLGGCAAYDEPVNNSVSNAEGKSCFWVSQVNGFNDAPDADDGGDRIYVNVGVNERYLFETFGPCPDLNWSETIAFDQRTPGQICSGLDVDLIVPTSIGPQRCPVRMISKVPNED